MITLECALYSNGQDLGTTEASESIGYSFVLRGPETSYDVIFMSPATLGRIFLQLLNRNQTLNILLFVLPGKNYEETSGITIILLFILECLPGFWQGNIPSFSSSPTTDLIIWPDILRQPFRKQSGE